MICLFISGLSVIGATTGGDPDDLYALAVLSEYDPPDSDSEPQTAALSSQRLHVAREALRCSRVLPQLGANSLRRLRRQPSQSPYRVTTVGEPLWLVHDSIMRLLATDE